mgnify:CR=1 FL=1
MSGNPFERYPRFSLGFIALVLIPLALQLRSLHVRSDADTLLESNPSQKATLEKVTAVFPDQIILIIDVECSDVFSKEGITGIATVSDAIMTIDGVRDVKSLTHSYKPVRKGFSFEMVPLVSRETSDPQALERLRNYCQSNPLIRNVMVSPDSRHATLTVTLDPVFNTQEAKRKLRSQLNTLFGDFETRDLFFEVIGLPLVEEEVDATIMADLRRFLPGVLLFLLVTLGVAFRSAWIVGFMLLNQAMALILIAGSLQWWGYPFTVFTLLLFPLWAGIHLTLLVHLGTACQRARMTQWGEVVPRATRQILKSCGFATLTTMAGLLSLGLAEIPQVREAGLVGAYGVAVVFVMTFGPGVALMTLYYRSTLGDLDWGLAGDHSDRDRSVDWLAKVRRFRGVIVGSSLGLVVLIAVSVPALRMGVRPIEFLPIESPSRSAGERFNESYGGFNMFQLEIDSGSNNGVNRLAFLQYLDRVQKYAEAQSGVSGAYSYAQVLAMMNQIWEGEKEGSLALPTNPLLLGTFSLVLKAQRFPFFEALCDADFRTANLVVRSPDQPSNEYLALLDKILAYAESEKPAGVSIHASQGLHSILEADQQLVKSQLKSAGLALGLILVLLVGLWRSWWLALVAVMVNALPVGLLVAVAAWLQIPLNSITVMIAAVAFGIAIDDTVHFLTQWLEIRTSGADPEGALGRAIQIKSRPMVTSSLVLGGIFALLMATSFPPVQHFGGLSALAFGLALGAVFVLLPAVLMGRSGPLAGAEPESA